MEPQWNKNGIAKLIDQYQVRQKRLLLLDFDGTVIEFYKNPEEAFPSGDLLNLLLELSSVPNNKLIIITGRQKDDIDFRLKNLPIEIVAEHGAMIKINSHWQRLFAFDAAWKQDAISIFKKFAFECKDSYVEEKEYSLAWHYRRADPVSGDFYRGKLIESLREIAESNNLRIFDGKKIVEIISKEINKGSAAKFLSNKYNSDYILCMGDDRTDEDMFAALSDQNNAFTVKIGSGESKAHYKLNDVQEANELLHRLLKFQ